MTTPPERPRSLEILPTQPSQTSNAYTDCALPPTNNIERIQAFADAQAAIINQTRPTAQIQQPITITHSRTQFPIVSDQKLKCTVNEIKDIKNYFFMTVMEMKENIDNLQQMQYQLVQTYRDFIRKIHEIPFKDQIIEN